MKRLLPLLCLLFLACPPPDYPVLFDYNGKCQNSLRIVEGLVKAKISGRITPVPWGGSFDIELVFEGLDTSRIAFFDTTNIMGYAYRRTHYFDDKVICESQMGRGGIYNIFIEKQNVFILMDWDIDLYKDYENMTREYFSAYMDELTAKIRIDKIFSESKLAEAKVDKQLMTRKLKGWVPALRQKE
jgi:hypothetical protein